MSKCPEGLQPCTIDHEGNEKPLIVPPAALEEARRLWPTMWIEPSPTLPVDGDDDNPPATGSIENVEGYASF